jgi:hypothetical protein
MKPPRSLFYAVMFVMMVSVFPAEAKDCSVSKEFQLRHPQELSGTLQDISGAPLPDLELQLLAGRRIIHDIRADNQGRYDFGRVAAGKYRVRIRYGGNPFCAPDVQCSEQGCTLGSRLEINPSEAILVN